MKMTESTSDPTSMESEDSDHEAIMDQVAKEMMQAMENKDKDQLLECFHCLVADIMDKMSSSEKE